MKYLLGFFASILWPFLSGVLSLAVIGYLGSVWYLLVAGYFVLFWMVLRYWAKHHGSEKWDSKLSDARMREALDEYVKEVSERRLLDS